MTITNHWLNGAVKDEIKGGAAMAVRRCLVIHHTAGASAKSSVASMRSQGLSAHLVVDRDGTIYQCRPFNVQCAHAGKSKWVDPNTGKTYTNINSCSIGIEIANAGDDPAVIKWAVKNAGAETGRAKHRNGGPEKEWEHYTDEQIKAVTDASWAIVQAYNLDDLTGHDCVSPDRKSDPGPLWPMLALREACGFTGLPVVHW
jgi:N-acetylmuramoyl-L-alanine amidase